MDETCIRLPWGGMLCAPLWPAACEYVRIVDAKGAELAYWDAAEWAEAPQDVMGAIVGAMCSRHEIIATFTGGGR